MTSKQFLSFTKEPAPYAFRNVPFDCSIALVDANKTSITGMEKQLQVTLRFHDTYDLVMDQSLLVHGATQYAIHPGTGTCDMRFMLQSYSAAFDGRAFCIEVRSTDGDVDSVFSSPITVVKEKLCMVQQPPDVWFKDEGGREKCMSVVAVLESAPGVPLEDRVIPLQVRLLYESGNQVANQSILRLFPDLRPNMANGRVEIQFRIDDVSKNHQGQNFKLEISPEQQDKSSMFQDIAPVCTSTIAIRSKRNKRKLGRETPRGGMIASPAAGHRPRYMPGNQYVMTPHPASGRPQMQPQQWSRPQNPTAMVEWKLAAFEIHPDGSQNVSRPIYRCPSCKRYNDIDMIKSGTAEHDGHCEHVQMLQQHQQQQQQPAPQMYQMDANNGFGQVSTPYGAPREAVSMPMHSPVNSLQARTPSGSGSTPLSGFVPQPAVPPHTPQAQQQQQPPPQQAPEEVGQTELNMVSSQRPALGTISPFMKQVATTNESSNLLQGSPLEMEFSQFGNDMEKFTADVSLSKQPFENGGGNTNGAPPAMAGFQPNFEENVYFILARMFTNEQGQKLGLPAFDQFQRMIGFYMENQNDAQTEVVFTPLEQVLLGDKEQQTILQNFSDEMAAGSDVIHSLPKHNNNLVILREDALMFCWSRSLASTM